MKLSVIKKGFSLIEVVVALFILSISVITIYNLIISTSVSSYDLEQRYLAKDCLLYTSPSPRDRTTSRMPSSA